MRRAKERIIFNDWDIFDDDFQADIKAFLCDEREDEPTENEVWEAVRDHMDFIWDEEWAQMKEFFEGKKLICTANLGLWDGRHAGGKVSDNFVDLVQSALEDCDYKKFYDVNGHFFIEGTHHDGTNFYEIKILTDAGYDYYERWNYGWGDERTEQQIHQKLMTNSRYAHLPRYAEKQWGCKRFEFEKEGK